MKMLRIVEQVIGLASAIESYWEAELPKRHPDYPLVRAGEESGPAPPQRQQLDDLLESLSESEVFSLLLLMHVGRGDISPQDWKKGLSQLEQSIGGKAAAIGQMTSKATLAAFLSDGLEELKKHRIRLDALQPRTAGR
jgi:hypothetical protein